MIIYMYIYIVLCIHIHSIIHMHTYMHRYTHMHPHVHTNLHIHIPTCICMCIKICICIHVCIHMCICICMCMHNACMCIHSLPQKQTKKVYPSVDCHAVVPHCWWRHLTDLRVTGRSGRRLRFWMSCKQMSMLVSIPKHSWHRKKLTSTNKQTKVYPSADCHAVIPHCW